MHTQRGAALHRAIQRARHQAVCVAAALIDVHAGVAALETRDRHAVAGHIRRALLLEFFPGFVHALWLLFPWMNRLFAAGSAKKYIVM